MENGDFWWDISVSHLHNFMGLGTMSTPKKQDDAGLENVSLNYRSFSVFILYLRWES